MRRTGKYVGSQEMVQTKGKPNVRTEHQVMEAVKRARARGTDDCSHVNVSTLTMTDRRTSPPTITVTVTCDDCGATL